MSTRSFARNLFPPLDNPELTIRRRSRADPTLLNDFEMAAEGNGDPSVPDLRTMEELYQPSLNGRGGPIAPIAIQATNFGLKNDIIQQVQNSCQFHGLSSDDANKHLDKFLHVTQSIKVNGVTDDTLRMYLFPHSLTHHANAWFDRFPRNSINTFEKMAKMFLGKYFPPSMVTKLRNEIINFRQRPDESLFEAWERYKLSIDRCPNHNMLPVTQIDTFYNGLTLRHRDTINAAAGGTFMKRRPEECYDLIKNMIAHHNHWDTSAQRSESSSSITSSSDLEIIALKTEMAEINKNFMRVLQPSLAKPRTYMLREPIMVENNQGRNQFFQGASHGQNLPLAYQAPAYQALGYQALVHQPLIPQPQVMTTNEFTNYMKANDVILKNMQTTMTSLTNSYLELKNMFGQFMKMNTALSSGSGTLPSNTVTNLKEDLKGITTHSGNAYQGPTIPTTSSSLPKVVERETEVTKDTMQPTNNGSNKDVQSPLCDKANDQKEKFFQIFKDLDFNISFADALILMPKFSPTIKTLLTNKYKLSVLARTPLNEHCSAVLLKKLPEKLGDPDKFLIPCDFLGMDECLALADLSASINLMPLSVWSKLSLPELSPTCMTLELADHSISLPVGVTEDVFVKVGTDFLLEEVDAFLALEDDATLPKVDHSYFDTEGDILLLEAFLNDDPSLPPPTQGKYLPQVRKELKICEAKNDRSLIDEPPEVELKDLPPHLEYAFLEGDDKFPVIIVKDLSVEEKAALIKVLKSHKQAIAWKLSNIKDINPEFCTHKILIEDDFEPAVQHQRRVNPKIHDVIKKEVEKLLDAKLIYPISDNPWVSPVHCVPKKGGFTVVENEENELITTRLVTGWREENPSEQSRLGIFLSKEIFEGEMIRIHNAFVHDEDYTYGKVACITHKLKG
nr:reverse transcriptase domain-containing protein [Tanacetum cinerariifolium]